MTTKEVVERYYEYANTGDQDNLLMLFAADVVMDEQLVGRLEGIDSLQGARDGIQRNYSVFHMEPEHVVVQGDEAAVFWHMQSVSASGVPVDAYGADYFSLKNGLIAYVRTVHDTVPFAPITSQGLGQ